MSGIDGLIEKKIKASDEFAKGTGEGARGGAAVPDIPLN
jgi:hypothetical protein